MKALLDPEEQRRRQEAKAAAAAARAAAEADQLQKQQKEAAGATSKCAGLAQKERVALVVGVQNYLKEHMSSLNTPINDAKCMSELLRTKGGFDQVIEVVDPDRNALWTALNQFRKTIDEHKKKGGCVALLYYAGHGLVDDNGKHYMVPQDYEVLEHLGPRESLRVHGVPLDGERGALSCLYAATAGIAILDTCNNLPPAGVDRRGAEGQQMRGFGDSAIHVGQGMTTVVYYACGPRLTAGDGRGNGILTASLLQHLCDPGHANVLVAFDAVTSEVHEKTKDSTSEQSPEVVGRLLAPFMNLKLVITGA